jgi:hypothetical protein
VIRPRSVFDRYRCNTRRWDEQGTDMNAKKKENIWDQDEILPLGLKDGGA